MERLSEHVIEHPDAYLCERGEAFGVSLQAIFYALRRLGLSYKKTQPHPKTNDKARIAF